MENEMKEYGIEIVQVLPIQDFEFSINWLLSANDMIWVIFKWIKSQSEIRHESGTNITI